MMTTRPKNILLVSFDDAVAYWPYKSCFGVPLQTPSLDRICEQSTAFQSAYCQAPICSPSRASFMSGQTPHALGVHEYNSDVFAQHSPEIMWSYRLKQAGWFCSSGGKVHHGFKPLPPEVHDVLYSDERKFFRIDWRLRPDRERIKFGGRMGGAGTTNPEDDKRFHDAHSANSAIEFLDSYDSDQPFYREVGFFSPHSPWITPVRFKRLYPAGRMTLPDAWDDDYAKTPFLKEESLENVKGRPDLWKKRTIRNYFSALSHADYHLGRIWDALKASQHADNTMVIIVSDHGFHLTERNRLGKSTLWEQVAGVPLIVHDPDRATPRVVRDPVGLIDVGPTVMEAAGLPKLDNCVGRSLLPYMDGYTDPDRAVLTTRRDSAAMRKGRYRIIRYSDGSTQLFDLEEDWWQMRDLGSGHPAHAALLAELVATSATYGVPTSQAA
ncbi:MAG: sulfatase-like hydrolase/transferase [Paracoccaceae bacterium]